MRGLLWLCAGLTAAQLPGWITSDMLDKADYRPNDIVISVPAKSGTTWTMNMVHQLRSGGDANFTDIYWEVPWLEFLEYPGQPIKELLSRWEHFPHNFRRAFKAHPAPPTLPFHPEVKYVVVVRNGLDAVASLVPFLASHSDEFFELWTPPGGHTDQAPDPVQMALGMMMSDSPYSGPNFLNGWWPLRHNENVFMVHYTNLTSNLPAVLRKMAKFLELEVPESRWPAIEEHCSFKWMQEHGSKFEMPEVLKDVASPSGKPIKVIKSGGMVRHGKSGEGMQLKPQVIESFNAIAKEKLTPEQYNWYMNGGELPAWTEAERAERNL